MIDSESKSQQIIATELFEGENDDTAKQIATGLFEGKIDPQQIIATELFEASEGNIEVLSPYATTFRNYISGINAHMVEEMNSIASDYKANLLALSSYRTFESVERTMLEKMNVLAQNTKNKYEALLPSINHNETFKKYIDTFDISNLITFEEYRALLKPDEDKKLPDDDKKLSEGERKDFLAYNKQHFQSFDQYLDKALEEASNEASKEASKEASNKSNNWAKQKKKIECYEPMEKCWSQIQGAICQKIGAKTSGPKIIEAYIYNQRIQRSTEKAALRVVNPAPIIAPSPLQILDSGKESVIQKPLLDAANPAPINAPSLNSEKKEESKPPLVAPIIYYKEYKASLDKDKKPSEDEFLPHSKLDKILNFKLIAMLVKCIDKILVFYQGPPPVPQKGQSSKIAMNSGLSRRGSVENTLTTILPALPLNRSNTQVHESAPLIEGTQTYSTSINGKSPTEVQFSQPDLQSGVISLELEAEVKGVMQRARSQSVNVKTGLQATNGVKGSFHQLI